LTFAENVKIYLIFHVFQYFDKIFISLSEAGWIK